MTQARKIRVLVVDDSAIVRKILTDALSGENDIEVVGSAPDPYIARDKIVSLQPDVLTLDIEMPRMDGITFLKKLMHYRPMPVIIISSLGQSGCRAALDAMQNGAVEVLAKPGGPYSVGELRMNLAQKIRAAAAARLNIPRDAAPAPAPAQAPSATPINGTPKQAVAPQPRPQPAAPPVLAAAHLRPGSIIAIGASTGGTDAIFQVLRQIPAQCPPIVVTQHIPPVFSKAFADRLNASCNIRVREAKDGDVLEPGCALVAPGDFHMVLRKNGAGYAVAVKTGPLVCYQRPSVDVLFASVAEAAGKNATGVILTGMGNDGAQGMLKMRQSGARTIAQDEATCVVFGMPREAIRAGAAEQVLPLQRIAAAMLQAAA